jgi:hypothetical protein
VGTARIRNQESMNSYASTFRLTDGSGVEQSNIGTYLALYQFAHCEDEKNEMKLMGTYPYDIGGNLFSLKARMDFPNASRGRIETTVNGLNRSVTGDIIAYPAYAPTGWVPRSWWSVESSLDSLPVRIGKGATAISRCRPAKPHASMATAVAEMYREGIPKTLKEMRDVKEAVSSFRGMSKSDKGKEIPSRYLEYQFGWKPLASDIQKSARAILEADRILEDLRRNSGKRIRRRYSFPTESSSVEIRRDNTRPWPNPDPYVLQQAGNYVVTKTDTKKTWFSGEFVYTFPGADAGIPRQIVHGARQLLGVDLTPETVWNIAPWTWLADWFANVGDVVSNFTAIGFDGLIVRYGYLMQEAERVYDHAHYGVSTPSGYIASTIHGKAVYTAKSRIVASPYGFGLTFDSLSPRQIAILTSIGITRRGRH